jgi:hypothetical protein
LARGVTGNADNYVPAVTVWRPTLAIIRDDVALVTAWRPTSAIIGCCALGDRGEASIGDHLG